jgi:UTP--glucose-1-phosphate uridylyltransferase
VEIKRAVITAAGKNQRTLPLQSLVDRDGVSKTALAIIIEEVLTAGIDEICVVVHPGDQSAYSAAAGKHYRRLHFVEQSEPLGYGDAVYCAHQFVDSDPFLLLVGDHLYLSEEPKSCAQQLVEIASVENCSVSAVQATHESKLPYYGAVGGRLVAGRQRLYEVEDLLEKATPTEAEQKLIVPGLRAGHYLCFFGMHVLMPHIMEILGGEIQAGTQATTEGLRGKRSGPVHLTAALSKLSANEKYLAYELRGRRFDIGVKYGLLTAQLALALEGLDRDEVLSNLVELLAIRGKRA